jgi:flagellin-like hook-associated protein FlgL
MASISLTQGIKNSLGALQDIQANIDKTNQRLATGKRVNTPLDGALNFFLGESFASKARGLSTILDGIGLGLGVLKQADKALESIKTSLEQAEGTLRASLNSAGTQGKITTNFSFRNQFTGAADPSATFAEAAAGTSANRLQAGDSFNVDLITYTAAGATVSAGTIAITLGATSTVQQVIDALNTTSAAGFNPLTAGAPRVQAYLNDAGNLVIENQVGGGDASTTNTYGIQIRVTQAAGATTQALDVFSISGAVGATPRVTSPSATLQIVDITGGSTAQTTRQAAAATFREVLKQIRNTALDAGFNGTNLLQGDFLRTVFNEEETTSIVTQGRRTDAASLGFSEDVISGTSQIGDTARNLQGDREISRALTKIRVAKDTLTGIRTAFAANSNLLTNRQDYTKFSVKNANDGSDLLTLADINEEGATLTTLQTRQQLSVTALSLSSQADQAILRLF